MSRRFLFRALIPAAALVLTGAIGLAPASAAPASWQIALTTGGATYSLFGSAAASSPGNAWVAGYA
jgi:hypothetical protein